jgi:hypothetical protein
VLGDIFEDNVLDGVIMNNLSNDEYPFWGHCGTALSTTITVTSPNGGEFLQTGTSKTITWTKGAGNTSVDIDVSRDNGVHWQTIATGLTGTSFNWTVTPPQAVNSARIRVPRHEPPESQRPEQPELHDLHQAAARDDAERRRVVRRVRRDRDPLGQHRGHRECEDPARARRRDLDAVRLDPNDAVEPIFLPNVQTTHGARDRVRRRRIGVPSDTSDTFFSICKRIGDPTNLATLDRSAQHRARRLQRRRHPRPRDAFAGAGLGGCRAGTRRGRGRQRQLRAGRLSGAVWHRRGLCS